jgi:hypothetical protein
MFPIVIRKQIQRSYLQRPNQNAFPHWPLDVTVDSIISSLMLMAIRASGQDSIPFIWFWPNSQSSCAVMTHDVESIKGRDFCSALMDMDDAYGIKASFQVIPEGRYPVPENFLDSIRQRGFEITVHDLNHDGHLYRNHAQFLKRAKKINAYIKQFQTEGFRAGALYRKQAWYQALDCSYDMSVPNTGRFDPQPGGCCTVMPYFVDNILEIPVTTTQDYTLFHILNDYSIDTWKRQTDQIMEMHGLMSFIVHPDYILQARARNCYESLIHHLNHLRQTRGVWITTPAELNRWWRQRTSMTLVQVDGAWTIQGEGSDQAGVAYAGEIDGQLSLTLPDSSVQLVGTENSAKESMGQWHLTTT